MSDSNSANDNSFFCACDECVNLAKKKYNGFFICDECIEYEIYIENGGLTTMPFDPESCEKFVCEELELDSESDDKNYEEVQWLTAC